MRTRPKGLRRVYLTVESTCEYCKGTGLRITKSNRASTLDTEIHVCQCMRLEHEIPDSIPEPQSPKAVS